MTATRRVTGNDRSVAAMACAIAVFVWGIGPLFVRELDPSTWTIVFWRMWLAQPVMMLMARFGDGLLDIRRMLSCWPSGLLFVGSILAGFSSFKHTSIANATLIQAMTPLVILLVAPRLFGERIRPRILMITAVAVAGLAMVVFGAGNTAGASIRGDLTAALSLVLFSAYFVTSKRARDSGMGTGTFLAGVFLVSALFMVPVGAVASGGHLFDVTRKDMMFFAILVLGPGLLGHGLMTWSQKHLSITTASLLTLGSPVVSTIGAWLVQHQRLTVWQTVGVAVVLAALCGVVLTMRQRPARVATLSAPPDAR